MNKYLLITLLFLSSCTFIPATEEELIDYCEKSEYSIRKEVSLTLLETIAAFFSTPLELNRGICEEYYRNREPANGYTTLKDTNVHN